MFKKYKQYDSTPFFSRVMSDMKALKSELYEHRYHLERKVEQRTTHLLKKITFLESSNATLCVKLAAAHKEISALRQQPALPVKDSASRVPQLKLCITDKASGSIGSQEHGTEHAA